MKDKVPVIIIAMCGIAAFVVLSQPAWRGTQMAAQFTSDCKARGGVLIVHHQPLGDNYFCESRLGMTTK